MVVDLLILILFSETAFNYRHEGWSRHSESAAGDERNQKNKNAGDKIGDEGARRTIKIIRRVILLMGH